MAGVRRSRSPGELSVMSPSVGYVFPAAHSLAWPGLTSALCIFSLLLNHSLCVFTKECIYLALCDLAFVTFYFLFSSSNCWEGQIWLAQLISLFPSHFMSCWETLGQVPLPGPLVVARGKVWSLATKPGPLSRDNFELGLSEGRCGIHTHNQTLYAR